MQLSQTLTLKNLAPGHSAVIVGYAECERPYRARLLAMGLTTETVITVVTRAPFGDPIEVRVRGYNLSLRAGEAAALILREIS